MISMLDTFSQTLFPKVSQKIIDLFKIQDFYTPFAHKQFSQSQ